ncbi:hypothetical protein BD414DRAFT_501438 [Trametes punicea]|nr:hypothetical protein BD414DRAFT_501438 [Trametes punicea]
MLANEEWKNDIIPEIMDGKNTMDLIDSKVVLKSSKRRTPTKANPACSTRETSARPSTLLQRARRSSTRRSRRRR